MPLLRTEVDFTNHFDEISREIEQLAERAVQVAAVEGAQVANGIGAQRNFSVDVERVRPTFDGFIASFVCRKVHAWFHEFGTLGSRRKKLKQPPRTNRTRAPGTGIEPLGFLSAGRRAGAAAMRRVVSGGA